MEKKEEDCVDLLVGLGVNRTTALVLVLLANVGEASSRDIERSIDHRQSDVSMRLQALKKKHWVSVKTKKQKTRGRPLKIYSLAIPFPAIIRDIEEEKKREAGRMIRRMKKLQSYVPAPAVEG